MKKTKKSLFKSVLALMLCFCMLLGTTFAWFSDLVTSSSNKIQAGNLKVDLELLDKETGNWKSLKKVTDPIFDYDKWEPGYTDVKVFKIENEGKLALKWMARFESEKALSILSDVIDVYVLPSDDELGYPADRDLTGYTRVGTLTQFINTLEDTTNGTLEAEECSYLGIALKMQESAGNEYQGLSLGGAFDIRILATQWTGENESDSFDNQYDKEATYPALFDSLQMSADINGKVDADNKLTEAIVLKDDTYGVVVTIPVGTLVDPTVSVLTLKINKDSVDGNVTLDQTVGYDVVVEGVAEGNEAPITVLMPRVLPKEQTAVQLFHDGNMMQRVYSDAELVSKSGDNDVYGDKYLYDAETGNVTFSLTHFSNVSLASTIKVMVMSKEIVGIEIDLSNPGDYMVDGTVTIPADGNVYIISHTRTDTTTKNELGPTLTHRWHNINPGEMFTGNIVMKKGAKVVLNGVNIRNSSDDALRIEPSAKDAKTYIYIADGTNNWLTGKSGIGFGTYVYADVYVEGNGCLYTTATGWGSPGIGVDAHTEGDGNKMHFNVGFLRSIPMNAAAGIGGGFANQSWRGLALVEINGGTYQCYRGGDAASIGCGLNGHFGDIVINAGTVNCYVNPWTSYGRNLGRGMYAGSCTGIYVSKDAYVYAWNHSSGYGEWVPGDVYVPSGMKQDASIVVNGFDPIIDLEVIDNNNGVYSRNDSLNLTVKVNRKYGGWAEVTDYSVSGIDLSKAGYHSGTIVYKEYLKTLSTTISDIRVIAPVRMLVEPKATLYNIGGLDTSGFKVTVFDSVGEATTLSNFDISVDGDINSNGHVNVTITSGDLSATCQVLLWDMTMLDGTANEHAMWWMIPSVFNVSGWSIHKAGTTYESYIGQTYTVPDSGEVVTGFSTTATWENNANGPMGLEYVRDSSFFDLTITNASRYTTLGINPCVGYDAPVSVFGYYFDNDMNTLTFAEPDRYPSVDAGSAQYLGPNMCTPNYLTCDLYSFKPGSTHTVHWVAIFENGIQTLGDWTVTLKTESSSGNDYEADPNKPNANVIILAGQSNATGSAPITDEIREMYADKQFNNVFINYINQEAVGNDVITYGTNGNKFDVYKLGIGGLDANHFGPELGLADYLSTHAYGENWFIIKYAPAGSELDRQWFGDAQLADRMIGYVQEKIDILARNYNVNVAGFVWMQGESDAANMAPGVADRYAANEQKIVKMVRDEFAVYAKRNSTALDTPGSGIVFVNGGISASGVWAEHATVNTAKKQNCAWWYDPVNVGFASQTTYNIANSVFVDTSTLISKNQSYVDGLDDYGNAQDNNDQAHYSDESMFDLGMWFGHALWSMIVNCP